MEAAAAASPLTELGGQPVPSGALVSAMFSVTHMAPDLWDDPHAFLPERHRPEPAGALEPARLHGVTIIPSRGGRVVLRPL